MALTPKKVYAILKKYTDNSVAGGGTIKGKNCVINSITSITGGHRVEFQWTLDNGTVQTQTMDVMDGVDGTDGDDGVGIASIDFKEKDTDGNNVYTVTYTDSNTDEIVCPIGPKGDDGADGVGIPSGGTANQILRKKSSTDYDTEWVDPSASSQIQSDWSQSDNTKVDFIKNKPTKLSDFSNDVNFITNTVNNLTNYYLTSETYTQAQVNALIGSITTIAFELVNTLPTTDIKTNVIYLVPKTVGTSTTNIYDEYICVDATTTPAKWELIGDTTIDLSGKADKVSGAISGNLAGLDANGNLTDSTVVASKVIQKVTTATGLLKDDGTVDTNTYQKEITISNKKVIV